MSYTKLNYLTDTYQFEDQSTVLDILTQNDSNQSIILDSTIMYPQGGGQPYDLGVLTQDDIVFKVSEVRFKDGVVYHIGKFESNSFATNSVVQVHVDSERRLLNARLHTAGHLVDDALFSLNYKLHPLKGYHYPDGPYVEYEGELKGDLTQIAKEVEVKINEIIKTNYNVHNEIVNSIEELKFKCMYIPSHIPDGKPIRIVYVSDPSKGQPCGGTHVKSLLEVGNVLIPKIKIKSSNTRVSYQIVS